MKERQCCWTRKERNIVSLLRRSQSLYTRVYGWLGMAQRIFAATADPLAYLRSWARLRLIQTDSDTKTTWSTGTSPRARICRSIFGWRAAHGIELGVAMPLKGTTLFGCAAIRGLITSSGDEGMLQAPGLGLCAILTRLEPSSVPRPISPLAATRGNVD